jgi:predicted phosphoribosyltransferase
MFKDREEAATQLASALTPFRNSRAVILAIPKGGIPIARHLSEALSLEMDVALAKKMSHPYDPVQTIGAISLNSALIDEQYDLPESYIESEIERIRHELKRKKKAYGNGRTHVSLKDRPVIIVDDGVTTGSTMLANIDLVQKANASDIIVAVPLSPPWPLSRLKQKADKVICLQSPADFLSVSQFYENYVELSETEAVSLLHQKENH